MELAAAAETWAVQLLCFTVHLNLGSLSLYLYLYPSSSQLSRLTTGKNTVRPFLSGNALFQVF